MNKYYLAIDIGASGGRHMLGYLENGTFMLEEIYRFSNGFESKDGQLCWDLTRLFNEILDGLKKCKEIGKIPTFMGIDTWGVDFVLLDKDDKIIGNTVSYRDLRTVGMDKIVGEHYSEVELYKRTGIQKQLFNTIYQLTAIKNTNPEYLEKAETILMIPEYFNFLLTGIKKAEYTNTTTGQLVSHETKDWDYQLIETLGFPTKMFPKISIPGTVLGKFTEEIKKELGFNCTVMLPPTHDTASSVLAIPILDDKSIFIGSGTWSLMGIERLDPDCSEASMKANFTNEGGYNYRFRFLKNIMGLWMIQSVRKELNDTYSYAELCQMASEESIKSIVDCSDDRFLSPNNMTEEIKKYCTETNQQLPETPGELACVIYNSLAKCYANTLHEIERLTGRNFDKILIAGGGANADYLNELTAKYTGKDVYAGPIESTAIGNIVSQMLHEKEFKSPEQARKCIAESFPIKFYKKGENK